MKRVSKTLLSLLLVFVLAFTMVGCGDKDSDDEGGRTVIGSKDKDRDKDKDTDTETDTEEAKPTKKPDKKPNEKPAQTEEPERVKMDATEIYKLIAKSVVQLNIYDADGAWISLGSGFFIDEEGTIITNYHVIDGAKRIVANDYSQHSYEVTQILGYDADMDIAFVKVDASTKPVKLYRGKQEVGETVYTLGSSEGFTGTFSDGIVSTVSRVLDGVDCIQITAPISHGNSGGPLINAYGEVIGINSMFYSEGQNLNFAININETDKIDLSSPQTMEKFAQNSQSGPSEKPEYTIVYNEGDEGMEIYEMCDYIELEDNNTGAGANALTDSMFMAAYLDKKDRDMFSFTIAKESTVYIAVQAYWEEDDDYLMAALTNEEGYIYLDEQGENLMIAEYDEENNWFFANITLPAGTYYVTAILDESYPFDGGAYYRVGAQWLSEE